MSSAASVTNHQLYQARQVLGLLEPGSHRDAEDPLVKPLADAAIFAVYRCYCFYLQELAQQLGINSTILDLDELLASVSQPGEALRELSQLNSEPGSWLSAMIIEYHSLFTPQSVGTAKSPGNTANLIQAQTESSDFYRFQDWLDRLESLIEKQRINSQEW